MPVMLLLLTFYLNGRLHAVSVGKPSERMSNFWTVRVRFSKTELEQNVGFPHITCQRPPSPIFVVKYDDVSFFSVSGC